MTLKEFMNNFNSLASQAHRTRVRVRVWVWVRVRVGGGVGIIGLA